MEERIDLLLQENRQVVDLLKKANTRSEKKQALEEFKEENKILFNLKIVLHFDIICLRDYGLAI